MVFALVHFTAGFVVVLAGLSAVPVTRYRLTGAYLGGIWALLPDAWNVVDGPLGARLAALHASRHADLFFFHGTLDEPAFRANNFELTFLSLVVLGVAFLGYDWRFGAGRSIAWRLVDGGPSEESSRGR